MKNKKIWAFILLLFFWFFSLLQWFSLSQAMKNRNLEAILFWFSLFFIFLGLFLLLFFLIKNKFLIGAILLGVFVPVFPKTTLEIVNIVLVIFGLFLFFSFLAHDRIKKEKSNCIRVDISRSIRAGMLFFVLAVSLLAGGYSFAVWKKENKINSVDFLSPQVSPTFVITIASFLKELIPDEKIKLIATDVTVDQYLEKIFTSDYSFLEKKDREITLPKELESKETNSIENQFQEQIFSLEKKRISQLIGREITGDEKISKVTAEVINFKIKNIFKTKKVSFNQLSWSFLIAAILTVYSLIWFFLYPLLWTCELFFYMLLKAKIIRKEKTMKEVEWLRVL